MTKNLLTSAVFGGVAAGLIAALLQFVFVIPALLEGELFETGARIHFGANGSPESDRGSPGLGTEWARHAMTVGFNVVTYVGFGFLLLAAMAFAELRGLSGASQGSLPFSLRLRLGFHLNCRVHLLLRLVRVRCGGLARWSRPAWVCGLSPLGVGTLRLVASFYC